MNNEVQLTFADLLSIICRIRSNCEALNIPFEVTARFPVILWSEDGKVRYSVVYPRV